MSAEDARRLLEEPVEIAVVDYGMGNRRSVEKAFEHIGARVTVTNDHDALREGRRSGGAGRGRVSARRWRTCANSASTSCCASAWRRARRCWASAWACSSAFERSTEQGGTPGLGLIAGEVRELEHGELKLPHIGWNEVSFHGPLASDRRIARALRLLPRALLRAGARRGARTSLGPRYTALPFASVVAHESFYGVQFHPEKSSAGGLRLLANFARICLRSAVTVAQ